MAPKIYYPDYTPDASLSYLTQQEADGLFTSLTVVDKNGVAMRAGDNVGGASVGWSGATGYDDSTEAMGVIVAQQFMGGALLAMVGPEHNDAVQPAGVVRIIDDPSGDFGGDRIEVASDKIDLSGEVAVNTAGLVAADYEIVATRPRFRKYLLLNETAAVDVWKRWDSVKTLLGAQFDGRTVTVDASLTGRLVWGSLVTDRRIGDIDVEVSFDGGTTWLGSGKLMRAEIPGNFQRSIPMHCETMRTGVVSGSLLARGMVRQSTLGVGGDLVFSDGFLKARVDLA